MQIKLSLLSVLLGLGVAVPSIYGLAKPAEFRAAVRKFPRSLGWGYALMLLGTLWFAYNVKQEQIADFEPLKPYLIGLFVAVGVGACIFLTDFLAVRGAAVLMLLLAKLMVDTARNPEPDTYWRLVIVTWAYVMAVIGMWFTISPWRMRDFLDYISLDERRVRRCSAVRVAFGFFILLLGLLVF
ncbi:MAG: hypothetical protein WCO56_27930 [Verrucomicrobiota bacterium]